MNAWEYIFTLGFFIVAAFVGLASHDGPIVNLGLPESLTDTAEQAIETTASDTQDTLKTLREEIREIRGGVRALEAGGQGLQEAGNSVTSSWTIQQYVAIAGLLFFILLGSFIGYQAWRNRKDSHQTMLVTLKLAESMEAFKEAELSENQLQRGMLKGYQPDVRSDDDE